jgi:hypothetical protein
MLMLPREKGSQGMEEEKVEPVVESQPYEGPPPGEQKAWNISMTAIVAAVAVIFLIVLVIFFVLD